MSARFDNEYIWMAVHIVSNLVNTFHLIAFISCGGGSSAFAVKDKQQNSLVNRWIVFALCVCGLFCSLTTFSVVETICSTECVACVYSPFKCKIDIDWNVFILCLSLSHIHKHWKLCKCWPCNTINRGMPECLPPWAHKPNHCFPV